MIVEDLLEKSDQELVEMLKSIHDEPIEWTPVILAELTRRNVVRLRDETQKLRQSSNKLEKLTWVLIILTIVLALLALPPFLEIGRGWISSHRETNTKTTGSIAQQQSQKSGVQDLSGLSNEDLFFLGASETRRRFSVAEIPRFKDRPVHIGDKFETDSKHWAVSRILKDGTIAADEYPKK